MSWLDEGDWSVDAPPARGDTSWTDTLSKYGDAAARFLQSDTGRLATSGIAGLYGYSSAKNNPGLAGYDGRITPQTASRSAEQGKYGPISRTTYGITAPTAAEALQTQINAAKAAGSGQQSSSSSSSNNPSDRGAGAGESSSFIDSVKGVWNNTPGAIKALGIGALASQLGIPALALKGGISLADWLSSKNESGGIPIQDSPYANYADYTGPSYTTGSGMEEDTGVTLSPVSSGDVTSGSWHGDGTTGYGYNNNSGNTYSTSDSDSTAARGGLASLHGFKRYAYGGSVGIAGQEVLPDQMAGGGVPRYVRGEGDGMSDDVAASIDGKEDAMIADGEFIIPADVVSHIGNGSSEAGAKQLYAMMGAIRKARTGTPAQAPQINPNKFLKG